MKKVSVQFNLTLLVEMTHKEIKEEIRMLLSDATGCRKITSIQINNIEKRGKR